MPSKRVKMKKISDSDSLSSFFISWERNRAPPIYPNAQTGGTVTLYEFWLFYIAVLLLIVSVGLGGVSFWSLLSKSLYKFLDTSMELAYFAAPVALLCLPASWITFSVHNDEKSRPFLAIVVVLLVVSIGVMVVGVYFGITHKLRLKPDQIERDPVLGEFRDSMRQSMGLGKIWDEIQTAMGCCGVDNYTDWAAIRNGIPESCCRKQAPCRQVNSTGCLRPVTATLALQTCVFSGINCVALFLQCCAFLVVTVIALSGESDD